MTWNNQVVHIVGVNIVAENQTLQQGLAHLRAFRDWRAEEIDRGLAAHGIRGALAGARRCSNDSHECRRGSDAALARARRSDVDEGIA